MKLKLKKPITFDGATITEFDFREEVTAGDLVGVKLDEMTLTDNLLKVASRLCSQPLPVLKKLSPKDLIAVGETISGFFEDGPTAGKTPSP